MMTVRFPNGHAVQYNSATHALRRSEYTDLYDRKDGNWLAQVPNSCIIEYVPACRVYNALCQPALDVLTKEVRSLRRKLNRLVS